MKVSGFTIVRNAVKFNYPVIESINSILSICDEFIVNVGDSQDGTLELIQSIASPKIKIIQTVWNMKQGATVLSQQTNIALNACTGDWAFYLQTDEVIHEDDLPKIKKAMALYLNDASVDALRFKWLHFYGSYYRYRIDRGWYQKQDRIIRNNGTIESFGDAFGFKRRDGKDLSVRPSGALLYHYGWVNSQEEMRRRAQNAMTIGYADSSKDLFGGYGDLSRFPVYFGSHPKVMTGLVKASRLSEEDKKLIRSQFWWSPKMWLKLRFKTGRRVKEAIINLPPPASGGVKLHVGCGTKKIAGWINIDSVKGCEPDLVHDLIYPLPYEDLSADEVLAEDLLEHFDKYMRVRVFYQWARVLKVGGKITLQVPNFAKLIEKRKKFKFDDFVDNLFGENLWNGRVYIGHFGNHKWGYSPESLADFIEPFGLTTLECKAVGLNIRLTAVKIKHVNQQQIDSLIIHSHNNKFGAD